jgi:hypothetical protein
MWRHREVNLDLLPDPPSPGASPEQFAQAGDFSAAVGAAIDSSLTAHQRRVVLALLVEDVPVDVLADRLGTTRNALYKTLHDARVQPRTTTKRADGPRPLDGRALAGGELMRAQRPPLTPETARRLTIDTEPWLCCDDCFEQGRPIPRGPAHRIGRGDAGDAGAPGRLCRVLRRGPVVADPDRRR